ncbi:hypothetical protein PAHAL_7G159800 [Panicum hallii]|uniref:FBD domain-containing protein n=1 Tax=Panicum hallii TaxID=206008 RepID=A0A2T8ICF1_9POAL|nr:hypothetical protein PAHAL_7G159800 [Panicum hallii]
MSFLTSRRAVQTCVLSRRWARLWCSAPCLNVDQREFNPTAAPEDWTAGKTPNTVRFLNFVDNLLSLHRAESLDTFRFHVSNWHGPGVAHQCLRRGIECCPEVLEFCYSYYDDYELPPLGSSSCRLRLHLAGIYLDKDFTLHLRSGCPTLIPHRGPFKLLRSLVNVRNLELSGLETLWNLHEGLDTFPAFPNVRTLVFNGCDTSDNLILECFLKSAASLQKLTLQDCKLAELTGKRKRIANPKVMSPKLREDAPAFECPNLMSTEFRYREDEFDELIGHLSGVRRNLQKSTSRLPKPEELFAWHECVCFYFFF